MLTQQQYESLNKEIEELCSRLDDLTVMMRLFNKEVRIYNDSDFRFTNKFSVLHKMVAKYI